MKTNIYNPKKLKHEINNYGFKFSYKNYLFYSLTIISGIMAISYLYGLNKLCMLTISLSLVAMIPSIIASLFKTSYNIKRFAELTDYLTNAIPLFLCKPKIIYVLKEVKHLTSGVINKKINAAITYLDNTVNDVNLYENALKIIADEYPNSRVISLHKFLISVEKSDSKNYRLIADTLYNDIENWIKRVLTYQKELLDKRNKLILLSLSTLIINSVFVYIYKGQSFFEGFVENEVYQISTTIFIILVSLIVTISINKLTGEWLIEDVNIKADKKIVNYYNLYSEKDTKLKPIAKLLFVLLVSAGTYLYLYEYQSYAYLLFIFAILLLSYKKIRYNNYYGKLKYYFKMMFPLWVRDVSLLIGNLTVLNAIKESTSYYTYPFTKEINKLLDEAMNNPTSIKPYNSFLEEYEIEAVKSNMRILFSLNGTDNDNVKERLSLLSERNQEQLSKTESLRNKNSLFLIDMLGFVPTLLFTGQTIISMAIMFKYVIENLGIDKYI